MMKIIQYLVIVGSLITVSSAIAEDDGGEVIRSLVAEKTIALECKIPQFPKSNYMRGEKYKSCMMDFGDKFVCLVPLTLVAEFTESFLVDTDVSNLSLRKDNSKQGSAYWWEYEALMYVRYFGNGETTFKVDRSDLSYFAVFQPKEGAEIVTAQGQCKLQDYERKF